MEQTKKEVTYLSLVESADDFPFGPAAEKYYRLYLPNDDQPHGYMLPGIVKQMPWTSDFVVQHDHPCSKRTSSFVLSTTDPLHLSSCSLFVQLVTLHHFVPTDLLTGVTMKDSSHGTATASAINTAFATLINHCIDRNLFTVLSGRHSEPFALVSARYDSPIYLERFATNLFGVTTRGAHLICYTSQPDGIRVWLQRRADHLFTYPGWLDSTVAGGVKSGVSPLQTIIEEADEEASLPSHLVRSSARSRGVLSHMSLTGRGFRGEQGLVMPDYIYVYDIELTSDVVPRPHDDEVSGFISLTIPELRATLLREEIKADAAAVCVDWMITHGFITAEDEPDFVEICQRLHRRLPFRNG